MERLSTGQAIPIAKQICKGLEGAHRIGVVHRDLKAQNVMVDEDGNARIMDFGIARSVGRIYCLLCHALFPAHFRLTEIVFNVYYG